MMQFLLTRKGRIHTHFFHTSTDLILAALILCALLGTTFPAYAKNKSDAEEQDRQEQVILLEKSAEENKTFAYGSFPQAPITKTPDRVVSVSMTAYNSLPEQTDSNPFETAMGTTTRHGIVATNFVPLGTYVKIPELYGDEVFIVEDRMNPRYDKRVDIWMKHYSDAKKFGVKRNISLEVYYEKPPLTAE